MSGISHESKVVVVSGAARGIGQALCQRFAESGASIVGVDLLDMDETGTLVKKTGSNWLDVRTDVSSPDAIDHLARTVLERGLTCDILVNCAATIAPKPFDDLDFAEWKRVLSINLDSQFLMSKAFLAPMKARGWGRIINFTSGSVLFPIPHYAAYKASKLGIVGLTRGMATDVGQHGITVNAVSPALTPTPGVVENGGDLQHVLDTVVAMQSIKRVSTTDDVTGLVLFLASESAGFITGQTMLVDGGTNFL